MAPKGELSNYANIVVLTGAGVSVASGIRPFRGPGGIWNEVDVMEYATAQAIRADPAKVWRFFAPVKAALATVSPNAAHRALAEFEARLGPGRTMTVITQNVDGLHQRAGSLNVVEIHGSLRRSRCMSFLCDSAAFDHSDACLDRAPACAACGGPLRMDVVLFEEGLPEKALTAVDRALQHCDFFLAVGTSGEVFPASTYVQRARLRGARTMLVNLESFPLADRLFDDVLLGKAEDVLPGLLRV